MQVIISKIKTKCNLTKKDILELNPGTILKVAQHSCANQGDILIRTSNRNHPLLNLKTGILWGCSLDDYFFEDLKGYKLIIEIE